MQEAQEENGCLCCTDGPHHGDPAGLPYWLVASLNPRKVPELTDRGLQNFGTRQLAIKLSRHLRRVLLLHVCVMSNTTCFGYGYLMTFEWGRLLLKPEPASPQSTMTAAVYDDVRETNISNVVPYVLCNDERHLDDE